MIGEYELKRLSHERFHNWIVVNILPNWCRTINPIETVRSLITLKLFKASCYVKEYYKGKPFVKVHFAI